MTDQEIELRNMLASTRSAARAMLAALNAVRRNPMAAVALAHSSCHATSDWELVRAAIDAAEAAGIKAQS